MACWVVSGAFVGRIEAGRDRLAVMVRAGSNLTEKPGRLGPPGLFKKESILWKSIGVVEPLIGAETAG